VPKVGRPNLHRTALDWARRDPEGLRSAARALAGRHGPPEGGASRLLAILKRHDPLDPPDAPASARLLRGRPQAIVEAVEILITRGEDVVTVLMHRGYTDERAIGGFLDRELPDRIRDRALRSNPGRPTPR
jgi:hypothetical protein